MASDVTTKDFIRFLNATRVQSACPACGKSPSKWGLFADDWEGNDSASEEPAMELLFHRFRKVREDGKPYGISTYAMFCHNCGHVEHIYQPIVAEWLSANPAKRS
ncbi:hypothetical protein U8291_16195 [Pseudomonas sp. A2]|uniref:hypothetical protein n=1 Tax=Pseudomonas sp. A2 TaxID=107445 RepID=UPI002ACCC942|nr:hypothetical protein [Pseudomonas sp. A2]MEB3438554.1 hypothetical protein [Pseudomonas sp. A2]HEN8732243.1 hypothetical protein [Pseudomonas putida]